jgi:hypothetical protein
MVKGGKKKTGPAKSKGKETVPARELTAGEKNPAGLARMREAVGRLSRSESMSARAFNREESQARSRRAVNRLGARAAQVTSDTLGKNRAQYARAPKYKIAEVNTKVRALADRANAINANAAKRSFALGRAQRSQKWAQQAEYQRLYSHS